MEGFFLLEAEAEVEIETSVLLTFGDVTGYATVFPDLYETVVVACADSDILDVEGRTANETRVPALEVACVELGSALEVAVVIDILDVGVHQVGRIATEVKVKVGGDVDDCVDGDLEVTEVE